MPSESLLSSMMQEDYSRSYPALAGDKGVKAWLREGC